MTKYSRIGRRHPDTAPISQDQIATLKKKVQRANENDQTKRASILDYMSDMWTQISYSFKPKSHQCRIYGHTLPHEGWKAGRRPNCGDCGTQINEASDLRKALPREY